MSKEKTQMNEKKPALRTWSIITMIFAIIGTSYLVLYPVFPFIIFIPGIVLWVIWFMIVLIVTVFTIGIIWANDGWKNFNTGFMNFNNSFWNGSNTVVDALVNSFKFIAPISGGFVALSFILSLIGFLTRDKESKYAKGYKSRFITMCVFLGLALISLIVDVTVGPKIY